MKHVVWRSIARSELAVLLKDAPRMSSQAVGEATIYRLAHGHSEILAIALPGGAAIVLEPAPRPVRKRRQVDVGVSPASR